MDEFAHMSSPPFSPTDSQRPLALSAMMEMTAMAVAQPLGLATLWGMVSCELLSRHPLGKAAGRLCRTGCSLCDILL